MNFSDIPVIGHVTVALFAFGFCVFLWMIYRKTRKVVKRTLKQRRRLSNKP